MSNEANETALAVLTAQREYAFRDIQILYDLSKVVKSDNSKRNQFLVRLKRIEALREEFVELTSKINTQNAQMKPPRPIDMKAVASFDDLYYEVLSIADSLQTQTQAASLAAAVASGSSSEFLYGSAKPTQGNPQARLPKLELPKFSGQIEHWQTFFDTYVSLVHDNRSISQVEKFHYLISCLSGPPLSLVRGVPVTEDNYPIVFDSLTNRYENKRVLAVTYLDKILNQSCIKNGSFQELSTLTNMLNETVNALIAMKVPNLHEFLLFYLASRTLDADTRKRFELQNKEEFPTFRELLTFLDGYVKVLETSGPIYSHPPPPRQKQHFKTSHSGTQKIKTNNLTASSQKPSGICTCCGLEHTLYQCTKFLNLDVTSRVKFVTKLGLCHNCLRPYHNATKCFSKISCASCGMRHHTLLHETSDTVSAAPCMVEQQTVAEESVVTTTTVAHLSHSRTLVLLGTCMVKVRGSGPNPSVTMARALIDSGAQDCFMTSALAQRLGLPLRRTNVSVAGLGQNIVHEVRGIASCTVQPRESNSPIFNINPIVMNKITAKLPSAELPSAVRDSFKHLVLADQNFDQPAEIDLLLGAELFHNIYDGQRLDSGPGLPVALHSIFGWVLTGRVETCRPPHITSSLFASTLHLEDVVKRFWEVEEPPLAKIENSEDIQCEKLYSELTTRDANGRYVVPILLKENHKPLGDSYSHALSRFRNLEKRLNKNESLKHDYSNFMEEYEDLGHMQPVTGLDTLSTGRYVIPHHCVIRPESSTTKLRVVFDASAKTSTGLSLNDIVYTGPKLQNDIVDILTKFRLHEVVFTADICKMYRNIELRPEDRKWQHILWRNEPAQPVQEFQLNTVTYGVTSSPYLAIRTLHQLADDHGSQWPRAAEVLRQDIFMDDLVAGAPSIEAASKLKGDLIDLLACAKFELRKWSSNCPQLLADVPREHCQTPKSFCEDSQNTLKILGVQWEPSGDFFTYSRLPSATPTLGFTKRTILSQIARIYDPVGWLTPVVLLAKLLLQDLWRLKVGWDEPVPQDVARQWQRFDEELQFLSEIRLTRRIDSSSRADLIGFCDGSSKAYGCCVYLRVVDPSDNVINTHLLIAKSKVAPLKLLTVNRLELCAAVLLARVMKHMKDLLRDQLDLRKVIAFTDSSVVLSWLRTDPDKLKTFVAHRVVKIKKDLPDTQWCHVSTHDNPADHCSRGLSCSKLANCPTWWSGPNWLQDSTDSRPMSNFENVRSVPELKSGYITLIETVDQVSNDLIEGWLEDTSSLFKLIRRCAWCLRFISNLRLSVDLRVRTGLTVQEYDRAFTVLIKFVQNKAFAEQMHLILLKKTCSRSIQKLNPFIDQLGLLRVGGRLRNSVLPTSAKHPVLLPKDSPLSTLIVDSSHVTNLHCGPRTLQSLIQRKYWILGIRNLIRSRLAKCVICFKVKPIPCQPIMGDLPAPRVIPTQCFRKVGIDFAGPFTVKESTRRNARTYKAYVCVFVCLAVKALHLEAVTELSTPAFLAALDRFVSRRNLCQFIITDNGTNFIGARRYLNELHALVSKDSENIHDKLAERGIVWQLNPPLGSHFGGIFESGVKSMKYHLKRVVGSQVLTLEELFTVLSKVEAVLNSRPLCNISSDPGEVDVLTPGHFLTGRPLSSLPEPDLVDVYIPPRSRWQMLQKLTQSFWRIWQQDYLHTLQQRSKWLKGQANVQLNDICLLLEPNLPVLEWRLGRVIALHPGADSIVRVVTLRTATNVVKRPVTKICPLPIQN